AAPELAASQPLRVDFLPFSPEHIRHAAPQPWRLDEQGLTIRLTPQYAEERPAILDGLLVIEDRHDDGPIRHAFTLSAAYQPGPVPQIDPAAGLPSAGLETAGLGLALALVLALAGGLLLNLMPCVLPVLSLKIF